MASDLLDIYNTSSSPRVVAVRQIPGLSVNYFDREGKISKEFTPNIQLKQTRFTTEALNYYDKYRQSFSVPESFQPIRQGVNLNRWNEKNSYYKAGQQQG
jgi:hypothetical protein